MARLKSKIRRPSSTASAVNRLIFITPSLSTTTTPYHITRTSILRHSRELHTWQTDSSALLHLYQPPPPRPTHRHTNINTLARQRTSHIITPALSTTTVPYTQTTISHKHQYSGTAENFTHDKQTHLHHSSFINHHHALHTDDHITPSTTELYT